MLNLNALSDMFVALKKLSATPDVVEQILTLLIPGWQNSWCDESNRQTACFIQAVSADLILPFESALLLLTLHKIANTHNQCGAKYIVHYAHIVITVPMLLLCFCS